MEDFKILEMNIPSDKAQISKWDTLFAGSPEYETIEWFILEDYILRDLAEVIETQYENYEIDEFSEIKKAFVERARSQLVPHTPAKPYQAQHERAAA